MTRELQDSSTNLRNSSSEVLSKSSENTKHDTASVSVEELRLADDSAIPDELVASSNSTACSNNLTISTNLTSSKAKSGTPREKILIFSVDSFANGIAIGQHRSWHGVDPRTIFGLRLNHDDSVVKVRSRYAMLRDQSPDSVEQHLARLSKQGFLRRSVLYFGVLSDPFFPFEGKFDASMKFLSLFKKFDPGLLVLQTRSPLAVISMPVLRGLGNKIMVTVPIESPLEDVVNRYTPGLPRVEERLSMIRTLRKFGVKVNLQIAPMLPYGEWRADARAFAELIAEHSDYVSIRSIVDVHGGSERRLKSDPVALRLAKDRAYHWLRPDTTSPLLDSLMSIAPEKLELPPGFEIRESQLSFFAA